LPRKAVEAVAEATMVMEKAMTPALMIKSTGSIRSVTNATRWGILQHIAERSQTPMMMLTALQQRRLTVSRSYRRTVSLQFAQVKKEFEPRISKLFKQAGSSVKIDLREVILLDSQSTMDLFCNAALVSKTCKYTTSMRLKSNGGTMLVTRKATMPGYNKDVWFRTRAITNIIALRNLIQQYHVTYDSDDKMFVVHRESQGKPNMEFRMHKCGLH
jgi:hypothetical protein